MDNTGIQKQLQFRRLLSQIQGIVKYNFVSSLKMRIFAKSFNRKERPRESAFSLNSAIGELGHFTQYKVRRGNEFSLGLYSYFYDIHQVEKFRQPYPLYTTGSPSPTNRDRVKWMAPLSSLWLNLSEPRTNKKENGTDKMSQMRKGNERQGGKLSPMRYDNGRNKGCNGRKDPRGCSQNQPSPLESTFYRK